MDLSLFIPEEIYLVAERVKVRYTEFPSSVFDAPFLGEGLREVRARTESLRSLTIDLRSRANSVRAVSQLKPAGFVFHVSRCGSTLLSQMLGVLPQNLVLSEPEVISYYLYSCLEERITFCPDEFRLLLDSYGQAFTGRETSFFVKFTSWNLVFLEQILAAYPGVPWVFLHRDPLEVLVSNFKKPTAPLRWYHARSDLAAKVSGIPEDELERLGPEPFLAKCIERYRKISEICLERFAGGVAISYRDLPEIVTGPLAEHFGLSLNGSEREQVQRRSRRHAKRPSRGRFVADSRKKQQEATRAMRAAVRECLGG